MRCTERLNRMDKVLLYVCFRWITSDDIDCARPKGGHDDVSEPGKLFGIEPFRTMSGRVNVVRGSRLLKPFIYQKHCAKQRFHAHKIPQDLPNLLKALKIS